MVAGLSKWFRHKYGIITSNFSSLKRRLIYRRSIAGKTVSAKEIELKSFNPFFWETTWQIKKGKHRAKGITIAKGPVLYCIVLSSQISEKLSEKCEVRWGQRPLKLKSMKHVIRFFFPEIVNRTTFLYIHQCLCKRLLWSSKM